MEVHATARGQIVIPSGLRRKYGIRAGTRIVIEDGGQHIILKPMTGRYLRQLQGVLKGRGALKALQAAHAEDLP
jgi:AbrB family looped-hinge helix DNA binding protein